MHRRDRLWCSLSPLLGLVVGWAPLWQLRWSWNPLLGPVVRWNLGEQLGWSWSPLLGPVIRWHPRDRRRSQ